MAQTTASNSNQIGSRDEYLISVVDNVATTLGFTNNKIHLNGGVGKGVNYLGDIHKISVEGIYEGKINTLNLVAKLVSQDDTKRKNAPIEFFCEIETYMYEKIFPKYDELQKELKTEHKFRTPKCYAVSDERFKEILLMEDLTKRGYEMSRIGKTIDYEHSVLLLEEMAKFHALSMVYKVKNNEEFNKLTESMPNLGNLDGMKMHNMLNMAIQHACQNVHTQAFLDVMTKYKTFDVYEKLKFQENGHNCKSSVIAHGDLWANNCLFKYQGNKPVSIMLVDWQCCRYMSPIADLYFVLFIAVGEEVRQKRFQELLNVYYQALMGYIAASGEDGGILYSETDFQKDLKTFSFAGVSKALFMLPIFTADHEEVEKKMATVQSDEDESEEDQWSVSDMYLSRVKQMAEDIKTHALDELW